VIDLKVKAAGAPPIGPLHVIHAVLSLDVGGLERIVLDLVREGACLGQRVTVVCVEKLGTLAPAAEALGAQVLSSGKPPGLHPGTIGKLVSIFREIRPDVIHSHQVGALVYAGPAAKAVGCPVVHTEHGKHYANRFRSRLLGRLAGRFTSRFFGVSGDIATEVETCRIVPRRKIGVVANGIDTARFGRRDDREATRSIFGIPSDAFLIGTVGRISEVKRQDRLIRAFATISELNPSAHLLLVGDGPLIDEMRRLAVELGVGARVHFAGYQTEPEKFLGAMDVFGLTSRSEGMPLAILESWASCVPVVASRVGGVPEMISDGKTGLLFDPEDQEALVAAISGLIADAELGRRISAAGLLQVREKYDVRVMAANYDRHYREVVTME
jgi:glycosyltransferase involved in cell wall biosynthesis